MDMVSETVLPFYVKVEPDSFLHYILGTLNPWQLLFNKTSLPAYPQVKNFDTNLPKLKFPCVPPNQPDSSLLSFLQKLYNTRYFKHSWDIAGEGSRRTLEQPPPPPPPSEVTEN